MDAHRFTACDDPDRDLLHFRHLSEWLRRTDLYGPRPFVEHRPAWLDEHPEVGDWLRSRSPIEIDELESASAFLDGSEVSGLSSPEPQLTGAPEALRSWWQRSRSLCRTPDLRPETVPELASLVRVGQRKLEQARGVWGLASRLPVRARVVDWCGGRGALARSLARGGLSVTVVDRDIELLQRTTLEARAEGSKIDTEPADVLDPRTAAHLRTADAATALHACGNLTTRLLDGVSEYGVPTAIVVPCCPHRLREDAIYCGRSLEAGRSGVELDDSALRLATAAVRVAPGRVRRARERELVLRQALDLALRDATGVDEYTPIGALPRSSRRLTTREFIEREFSMREISLPVSFDPAKYERAGIARVREARALGIVRALFRRPIELWTDLDHVIAEREAGRTVRWGRLYESRITPRNIAIETRSRA